MQLAPTHKGWENEHLATFLLSRIAFVASPVTVADDIGTDIFGTLFEVRKHKGQDVLLPRSSIAVQVKSNRNPVDVASKLDYLHRLEVPYYLGVVDQKHLTLELFSARFLPVLLSWRPHHARLFLAPVDEFQRNYRPKADDGVFTLLCHKVATLDAHDDSSAIARCAEAIREDSRAALQAIASRLNQEYVFEIAGGEVEIYAGPGSAQTFRRAFFKRLGEVYFNLSFLLDTKQAASEAEMDAFIAITDELIRGVPVPDYVMRLREGLQNRRSVRVCNRAKRAKGTKAKRGCSVYTTKWRGALAVAPRVFSVRSVARARRDRLRTVPPKGKVVWGKTWFPPSTGRR